MAIFNTVQLTKLCKNRCPIQQDTLPCLDSGQVDEIAFMVQFQTYELKWALKSRQQFKLCAAKKGKEMREAKKRKFLAPEFKAKVGLEALRGVKTSNEIGQEYGVHPVQVGQWKKAIQAQAKTLFEGKRGPQRTAAHQEPELLYSEIGQAEGGTRLAQKKVRDEPVMMRQTWIDKEDAVAVVRQCVLAGVSRATIYARQTPRPIADGDLLLNRPIDEEYTRRPFYGSRKMVIFLQGSGHAVNRKRVQRLMRRLGLAGMAPGPNTSGAHPEHKIYPYLLRGVPVVRPNQVWSTDVTYIRLARGFVYLARIPMRRDLLTV